MENELVTAERPLNPIVAMENELVAAERPLICWFCGEGEYNEGVDVVNVWARPCKCNDAVYGIHRLCLRHYIDREQRRNYFRSSPTTCSICKTPYIIDMPTMGLFADLLEFVDASIDRFRLYPIAAATVLAPTLHGTALLYGAVVVDNILGLDLDRIFKHRLLACVGLPAIPICLLLCKMIRWDDYILRYLQSRRGQVCQTFDDVVVANDRVSPSATEYGLRTLEEEGRALIEEIEAATATFDDGSVANDELCDLMERCYELRALIERGEELHALIEQRDELNALLAENERLRTSAEEITEAVYRHRHEKTIEKFYGGLLLPWVAEGIGRLFFGFVTNKFYRSIFGGVAFIVAKGVTRMAYVQLRKFAKNCRPIIIDYNRAK